MKEIYTTNGIGRLIADASKTSSIAVTFDYAKLPPVTIPYGAIVAKVTATGKGRLYAKAKVKTAGSTLSTVEIKTVDANDNFVNPFVVGDVISIGATNSITITAIDYTANTIDISPATTVAEDAVIVTADGGQTAVGILYAEIANTNTDWNDEDRQAAVIDYGIVYENACVNLDSTAKTAIGSFIKFR